MQKFMNRNVVFLSSSHMGQSSWNIGEGVPEYLQGLQGVRWVYPQGPKELKAYLDVQLDVQTEEVFVVVRVSNLTQRVIQAFLSWSHLYLKISFIFIAQTIENTAHQMDALSSKLLFIYESESPRIAQIVTRRLMGLMVKTRKQERKPVQTPVILKKSATEEVAAPGRVQYLKEGQMRDFSKGGAQIFLGQECVRLKDFISLMYQNRNGEWVSVESQVRWVVSTGQGQQLIGVQFLALSA
ncbi:MAG: PilZ domain-containing protein [Bdellovibrio sp.]|nr:PilZ domain-containing protein [Bdellovibrio sp.]